MHIAHSLLFLSIVLLKFHIAADTAGGWPPQISTVPPHMQMSADAAANNPPNEILNIFFLPIA
jgi:hypothetical protein